MSRKKIRDEFSDLPVSRQRKYQLRKKAAKQCRTCGRAAINATYCDVCRKRCNARNTASRNRPYKNPEPLTDAVFERLGFAILDRGFVVAQYKHADAHSRTLLIGACVDGQWFLSTSGSMSGGFITIPPCHTVGEWWMLCERLGIQSKEGE